jgi:hypothetical protein
MITAPDHVFITTRLGDPGSGRARYGAAMALFRDGELSAEQLECYRIASADDGLDPAALLRERGLGVLQTREPPLETLIRTLVDEANVYIGKLGGPGIADVHSGIARFRNAPYLQPVPAANSIVTQHLAAAISSAAASEPALLALIAAVAPFLKWVTYDLYDRSKIGEAFATGHAFCSIMGEDGAICTDDFNLGLFLIAPNVLYRDHHHAAPELYAPLTGPHGWRFKPGAPLVIKPAHEPVWNEPFRPHLTKVGPTPFLCLYCWTRDNDKPAQVLAANDWPELESLRL